MLITFELTSNGQVRAGVPDKRIFCSRMGKEMPNNQIFAFDDPVLRLNSLLTDVQWVQLLDGKPVEIEGDLSILQYDYCDSVIEEWSREWPTELGHYWFYGWPHRFSVEPEMHLVWLSEQGNHFSLIEKPNTLYVIHKSHARGLWKRALVPEKPGADLLTELEKTG